MSKIALITVTKLYQQMANADQAKQGIIFNSVCPGYCATDLNNHSGYLTADQGNFLKSVSNFFFLAFIAEFLR